MAATSVQPVFWVEDWRYIAVCLLASLAMALVFLPVLPAKGEDGEPPTRLELSRLARDAIGGQL